MLVNRFLSARAAAALLCGGLAAMTAHAQDLSEQDISVLAGSCAACHGTDGRSPGAIPPLAGVDFDHLHQRLIAFKRGEAEDATVMGRHASGYTEEELEALARHYSQIEP